jgi:uncharacterized membrane protein
MKSTAPILASIILIALASIGMTFYSYYRYFGDFKIVPAVDKWGQFGDYIGGVLNPILSFLGLIGLLITIYQNQNELAQTRIEIQKTSEAAQRQAEHFEREEEVSELVRIIERIHLDLLSQLEVELTDIIYADDDITETARFTKTVGFILSGISNDAHLMIPLPITEGRSSNFHRVAGWITELSGYLHKYMSITNRDTLPKFYALRYGAYIKLLEKNEYLDKSVGDFYRNLIPFFNLSVGVRL